MIVVFSGSLSFIHLGYRNLVHSRIGQRLIPLGLAAVHSLDQTHLALDPAVTYSSVDP
jgi:hypothetical protein